MALKLGDDPREELPPAIGDNTQVANLSDILRDQYAKLPREAKRLIDRIDLLPPEIKTDSDHAPWADLAKDIDTFCKRVEAYREHEKAPWLTGSRQVDNFFKAISEPLEVQYESIGHTIGAYLDAKKQRAEALLREQRRKADEELRKKQEDARKAEAEAKKAADEAARKIAERDKVSLQTAKRRVAIEPPKAVAKKIEKAEAIAYDATVAERRVDHVAARQAGPAASIARTRATQAVSTLQEIWTFEILNIDKVPLEVLRPYLKTEAIEQAIGGFIRAGRRELAGVRIYKKPKGQIR